MPSELYGPAGALAALVFVVLAMIRGDLVPGFIYRKTEQRADKADAALLDLLTKRPADDDRG